MTSKSDTVIAASLTPLNNDLSIDHGLLYSHVSRLLQNGCDSVLLFGTTGEANSFSVAERQEALQQLLANGIPASLLMVGTGCCALPDTLALTRHALEVGVNRCVVLPPFYYKNPDDEGIAASFTKLIQQTGNPLLRIYLYHFPKMAVVSFNSRLIATLADRFPAQIAGIKDSTGDPEHTMMLNKQFPAMTVYAGNESFLLKYLRFGGPGCISATANLTAPLAARVSAERVLPSADALQQHLSEIRAEFERYPMIGSLKGYLAELTGYAGWRNLRPPLSRPEPGATAALAQRLEELGFEANYD